MIESHTVQESVMRRLLIAKKGSSVSDEAVRPFARSFMPNDLGVSP